MLFALVYLACLLPVVAVSVIALNVNRNVVSTYNEIT